MPIFLLTALGWARSAFSAILTFCSKPPGSWIAASAALALGLWWFGHHEFNRGEEKCRADAVNAAADINAGQPKIIERLRTVYVPAETKIKLVTKTIVKEVPVYVTKSDDAACTINNGFVRVHDAAAHGELPGNPSGIDGEPSGVKLSAVAQTVADNYGTCRLALSRDAEWQDWYLQNKALWDSHK